MSTFMYHKTEAPKGIVFEDDELEGLGDDWVDTPAGFSKPEKTEQQKREEEALKKKQAEQAIKDKAKNKAKKAKKKAEVDEIVKQVKRDNS